MRSVNSGAEPDGAEGVAHALGAAVSGEVRAEDFVWEPSRGWLVDALWGRGVVFVARVEGPEEPQDDVFRTEVRLSREGRVLSVAEPANLSLTPLANEASLLTSGTKIAFASKRGDQFTGITVVDAFAACADGGRIACGFAAVAGRLEPTLHRDGIARWAVGFRGAVKALELQWHGGGLEAKLDDSVMRLEFEPFSVRSSSSVETSPYGWSVPVRLPRLMDALAGVRERKVETAQSDSALLESTGTELASDRGWPPRVDGAPGSGWTTRVEGVDPTAPAVVVRDLTLSDGGKATLAAIDTRQLELHANGGFRRPRPSTGPGASGAIPETLRSRVVARLDAHPGSDEGGFIERGRVLRPLGTWPSVWVDEHGDAAIGTWPEGAIAGEASSVVQTTGVKVRGPLAALCTTRDRQLYFAWSEDASVASLGETLDRVGCFKTLILEAGADPLVSGESLASSESSEDSFFFLVRRDLERALDEGHRLAPISLPSVDPAWLPAVRRSTLDSRSSEIVVTTIDVERFDWHLLSGVTEGRGRTFDAGLDDGEQARVALAIGLGTSAPGRRRGLALGGAVATPFTEDRGVLAARGASLPTLSRSLGTTPSLELGLSSSGMVATADAAELVLLAEGGRARSEALELGELRPRSALCMRTSSELLYAESKLDSPEALVEAMLALGCRRIVSTDRGRQGRAVIELRGVDESPRAHPNDVVLVGLTRPSLGRSRWWQSDEPGGEASAPP